MILKRKQFVIQWRKFGLKRSCILKVMNLGSLCLFLIFYLIFKSIFKCFFPYLNREKGGELTVGDDVARGPRRRANVAGRSARGCDVALRPRGRATAGPRGAQVELTRVTGGQAGGSTWAPVWGRDNMHL